MREFVSPPGSCVGNKLENSKNLVGFKYINC